MKKPKPGWYLVIGTSLPQRFDEYKDMVEAREKAGAEGKDFDSWSVQQLAIKKTIDLARFRYI